MCADDFVMAIAQATDQTSACQVAIDPQAGGQLGGLGVPVAANEAGADSCTLEELGVIPGDIGTKATLGTKHSSDFASGKQRKQLASDSLAIVPYDPDSAISPPPRPRSDSPPPLGAPDYLMAISPSPPALRPYEQQVMRSDRTDLEQRTRGHQLDRWVYPAAYYATLFALLSAECRASPNLRVAVWEFLQSIPTCDLDEAETVNVETTTVPSNIFRTLYRLRILGVKYQTEYVGEPSKDQAAGFNHMVEVLLDVLTGLHPHVCEFVLPSLSGVVLWAVTKAANLEGFSSGLHCQRIAELVLVMHKVHSAHVLHDCTKVRRVPPAGRLCDDCVRTRRRIRSVVELLEAFRLVLRGGGQPLWSMFFVLPLARSIIWDTLVVNPIAILRQSMKRVVDEINSPELMECLVACERKLEAIDHTDSAFTCEHLFSCLIDRLNASNKDTFNQHEMFERLTKLILEWPSDHKASDASDALFVQFAQLVIKLVPSILPSGQQFVKQSLSGFVLNVDDVDLAQKERIRSAMAAFVRAVSRASNTGPLVLGQLDDFLLSTPTPLRRQDKGWGFEIDWSVDPCSSESGSMRLRKTGVMAGLVNRGSTCYANSVLQMLFSVEPFRQALLTAKLPPKHGELPAIAELTTTTTPSMYDTAPPPPPVLKKKQSIAKAWQCWGSGVNDLTALTCRICEMPRPEDYEIVSESFSYAMPSELMVQIQQQEEEEEQQLVVAQRASSTASTSSVMKEDSPVEICRQLQRTFAFLSYGRLSCFDPYRLITACKPLNLQFPVTSQNDASEYYDKLLDAIDSGLKKHGNDDATDTLKRCFLGKQVKLKRCQVCDNVSFSKDEEFYRLELTVKNEQSTKNDLRECLDAFTAPEDMFGDNKVDCDFCKMRTNTTFVTCLTSIPNFLFIHPKRFAYDLESNQTVKLNHYISFPSQLDLFPYTREGIVFDTKESEDESANVPQRVFTPSPPTAAQSPSTTPTKDAIWYDLRGVLVHRGRAGGGHYYAFIEEEGVNANAKRRWVQFNDDRVSSFDVSRLPDECFGGRVERSTTDQWGVSRTETIDNEKSAFMLLYVRRDGTQSIVEPIPAVVKKDDDRMDVAEDAKDLDLSERDMFQEQWTDDKDLSGDISMSFEDDDIEELAPSKQSKSVPKPMSVFASKSNSLANASLMQAQAFAEQRQRDLATKMQIEDDALQALRREVDEASMAVTKQALLFSSVTQDLSLDVLSDQLMSMTTEASDSMTLLAPAFRVFFCVVAKFKQTGSHGGSDSTVDAATNAACQRWISCLNQLLALASFETRTAFADHLLQTWISAPQFTSSESEIGVMMGTMFSLVETLLDCPEKRVRTFYLEGVCALLRYASQVTMRSLVDALLRTFRSSFQLLPTQAKQKLFMDGLLAILDRICVQGGSASKQVVMESGSLDAIVAAMLTPPTNQPLALPSLESIVTCCSFLSSFIKDGALNSLESNSPLLDRLKSFQLRNLLTEIGLNSINEAVQTVLLAQMLLLSENPEGIVAFIDKLLEVIVAECNSSGNNAMSTDLPYDSTIVSNVLGEQSDMTRMNFLAKAVLNSGDQTKLVLERLIEVAYSATITPQVMDALQNGVMIQLPRHTVWEERLYPLDATNLRVTCRIIACIVQKCLPELLKRSPVNAEALSSLRIFQEVLQQSDKWRTLRIWFLCVSSPLNQMCHTNGMDTDGIRRLVSALRETQITVEDEEQVERLIGATPSDVCLRVEGAGSLFVNGVYRYMQPQVNSHPRWMSHNGLSIYRCPLSNGSEEWFLSKLEPGVHPSDERNIDYYSSTAFAKSTRVMVPHPADWTTLSKGRGPSPIIRKILERDLVVLDVPPAVASPPPPPPEQDNSQFFSSSSQQQGDDSLYGLDDPDIALTRQMTSADSPGSIDDNDFS